MEELKKKKPWHKQKVCELGCEGGSGSGVIYMGSIASWFMEELTVSQLATP